MAKFGTKIAKDTLLNYYAARRTKVPLEKIAMDEKAKQFSELKKGEKCSKRILQKPPVNDASIFSSVNLNLSRALRVRKSVKPAQPSPPIAPVIQTGESAKLDRIIRSALAAEMKTDSESEQTLLKLIA